ncbi:4-diphosphocytidyl-2C-methyl-D-erythritol kinase [Methylopila jiangsuensis]|uniref:4-diphosphocytidyl-2C-methyl-D-erythritol kinase n=1 Tax=Methylopila jiangsuensis TaxID=586230 RepID=A0A9W6N4I4_9HYPH|nr:molybdopterin-binding/glycosyltransferase family 2 protein [Methylopila jiangsuensis]MDR6284440.1 molybdenum cofactor cytidylyltransferase [Methylopila jiangsuensis]GLK78174.1 4-diphosphocytidyl-2C-methyl-D-erythritol kinase [Methylopila jiangsuensis]
MRFGAVPLDDAVGAVAAHAVRAAGFLLKKGATVTARDVAELGARGVRELVVASLEADDVPEDEAARRIASALTGAGLAAEAPFTGRVNVYAERAGLLLVNAGGVDALNLIDEDVTLATLAQHAPVAAGAMVATIKIIPFALPETVVAKAETAARAAAPVIRLAPFAPLKVGVVSTLLPGLSPKVVDKTIATLERRLAPAGARIVGELRVEHDAQALAGALARLSPAAPELVIVFGASAVTDRRDVAPMAIEALGGTVERLGMPVDPGNLLLLGRLGDVTVIGAPGCARSPKENGFDWVLNRLLAGLPMTGREMAGMGVGGLLMEIAARPQPRETPSEGKARIAGIVLAAGRSRRMGGPNKLLETVDGRPMARHAAEAAVAAGLSEVVVVVGHQREQVMAALDGLPVRFVANPDFADGLSTSLRAGLAALAPGTDAALVALGDMPRVGPDLIRRLVAAFDPAAGAHAVLPVHDGARGNPVLWGRRFFPELMAVTGDVGGRALIGPNADWVREVEIADAAPVTDVDTPEALRALRGG